MARIIFLEPPRADVDISTAEAFGERVDLYVPFRRGDARDDSAESRRPSVMDFERFTVSVLQKLASIDYDPQVDVIVLTGSQMLLALTLSALAIAHHRFLTLAFNTVASQYVLKEYDSSWAAAALATTRH